MAAEVEIPLSVRVEFAHAAVQTIATDTGVDLLHVKGPALAPELRWPGRTSTDADVLVRPAHIPALLGSLQEHGWRLSTGFVSGSDFEHAATLHHPSFGYLDLHRHFPGFERPAVDVFEALWTMRVHRLLTSVLCPVPNPVDQRLIVLLHAARSPTGPRSRLDIAHLWERATEAERSSTLARAEALGAEVAFAVVAGDLERFGNRPSYGLWRLGGCGGSRLDHWWARLRAAPTRGEALRIIMRAPLVNVDHLAANLGRRPARTELVREFFARPIRGVREHLEIHRARRRQHNSVSGVDLF